ncbi:hypothetical protein [Baaleninema simplex]|uniref:hypothetical protein n=1 Tax=Baaleninema simplex TaxID=2862350 RepID=UPI0003467E1B|nr:hypothetical protein [Baaleninema simplex]
MTYTFDFEIVTVTPVLNFFNHQQEHENNPKRSRAYLGSYDCSLDGFVRSMELVHEKPDWDWDEVVRAIVNFWLEREERVRHWKTIFQKSEDDCIVVGRVANYNRLRQEFELLF